MGRRYYGGNKNRGNKQQKTDKEGSSNVTFSSLSADQRKRFLSSETSETGEDAEVLLDAVLGALTNSDRYN